jgi:hypothetical protein
MSHSMCRWIRCLSVAIVIAGFCGCNSYTVPGRGANLNLMAADSGTSNPTAGDNGSAKTAGRDIEIMQRTPTASFPAHIAVVRIQEPGYKSMTNEGIGGGRYSVITVRDIETDEDFARLGRLPSVADIAPLSRLLMPSAFESDKELRQAAARVQADMLLVYTVDTSFLDTDKSTVLGVVTLGFGPTIDVRVITTVSALLLDTQTGYVYGTIEETAREQATAAAMNTKNTCDTLRLKTERQAFDSFLSEIETVWPKIVESYKK